MFKMSDVRHMRPLIKALITSLLVICFSFGELGVAVQQRTREPSGPSAAQQPSQKAQPKRARLVLLIVVDQFRYDYLERFGDLFVENGLKRLLRDGASWIEAHYDHTPTYTAPGHATLMTGAWPAETGIIANEWLDRDAGKKVTSVSDETAILLGGEAGEGAASPRRLMASTLCDELRLTTQGRSKVIGISVKDRSAILPAGRHASAAYWFSMRSGRMVSSNYYFNQLPAWVLNFNKARPADKYFGARWERLLPEPEYSKRAGPDAPAWEQIGDAAGETNAFPHTITGGVSAPGEAFYDALAHSPFSNDLLLSFAQQAIINENLGRDEDTDILSLSFSANDHVGHRYGPYSQEVMDISLRTDRQIAALLDFVDKHVGLQNTFVIFTADHGVAPIPAHAAAMNLPGGTIMNSDVLRAIRLAISARYNRQTGPKDSTADYILQFKQGDQDVQGFINGNVYFNTVALKRDGINNEEIENLAGEAAMTVPGIRRYFTRTQLQRGAIAPADPLARRVLHGFYPSRSGDVIVIYDPFKYLVGSWITATHGSPYSYDTHVPLIMMGGGLSAGRYLQAATPADIAPTLAAILGMQSPSNATGRILREGFQTAGAER